MINIKQIYEDVFGSIAHSTIGQIDYGMKCFEIAFALNGAMVDTLNEAILHGPLEDGDVPSKTGRDHLLESGLMVKIILQGKDSFNAATYFGRDVHKARQAIIAFRPIGAIGV